MESLTQKEKEIVEILRSETGIEKPIFGSVLASRVRTKNVYKLIGSLRIKRFPICQKGRRYFYAHENSHLDGFIKNLERELEVKKATLEGLKASYFNVNSFERNFGSGGEVDYFITKAVRTDDGRVAHRQFKVGPDGNPIIPKGTKLI